MKNPCTDPLKNQILTPADFSADYKLHSNALRVDYSSGYSVSLASLCGSALSYSITSGLTTFVTDVGADLDISIYSIDQAFDGTTHVVIVEAFMTNYPTVRATPPVRIMINFSNCVISDVNMPTLQTVEYTIGDPAMIVPISAFESAQALACNLNWVYSARLNSDPTEGADMSSYMVFDDQTLSLSVSSQSG